MYTDINGEITQFADFEASSNGWLNFKIADRPTLAGTEIRLVVDVYEPDPTPVSKKGKGKGKSKEGKGRALPNDNSKKSRVKSQEKGNSSRSKGTYVLLCLSFV